MDAKHKAYIALVLFVITASGVAGCVYNTQWTIQQSEQGHLDNIRLCIESGGSAVVQSRDSFACIQPAIIAR